MGFFKLRSDYFKGLASRNKLVMHGRELEPGEVRKAFHRMNDENELLSACVNWAHFPCVVHTGMGGRYTDVKQAVVKRKVTHQLIFLVKVKHPTDLDGREDAYDLAFTVMEEFIQEMYGTFIENGYCSQFHNLDLNRFSFSPYELNGNLFGLLLQFEEDLFADQLTRRDGTKWME